MNVAIFGAGVAGMAAAAALSALGHHCRLYERCASRLGAGMAFILMPEGLQQLQAQGMWLDEGMPLHRYLHRDAQGRVLAEMPMPRGARCVLRRHLLQALARAVPTEALVTAEGGLAHLELDAAGRVARARLESGYAVEADLYVAADGVHSQARASLFPHWHSPPARVFEVVGLVEDDETARQAGHDFNKFHDPRGGLAFGLLPAHRHTLVWYLQFDARRLPSHELPSASGLRAWLASCVGSWAPAVVRALAWADASQMHLWRPVDADPVPCFHRGNLVLLGDAAHPLLPFSSQGCGAALRDAEALARCLQQGPRLDVALARYSRERRHACLPYVKQGRAIAERFLAPGAGGAAIPVAH